MAMQVSDGNPHVHFPGSGKDVLEQIVRLSSTADIRQLDRLFLDGACALLPLDYMLAYFSGANGKGTQMRRSWDNASRSYRTVWQQEALSDTELALFDRARRSPDGAQTNVGKDRLRAAFCLQGERGNAVNLLMQYPAAIDSEQMAAFMAFRRVYFNFRGFIDASQRDPLTGLLNRRYFDDCIHHALEVAGEDRRHAVIDALRRSTDTRQSRPWLAILDIDHFKRFNDAFGHLYGDEILLLFARIMERTFRESDLLFRFGGEEFVVIMENASADEAMAALERFRMAVQDYVFPQGGKVTVSSGAIEAVKHSSPTSLLGKADEALYYAKNNGRNRTVMYEDLLAAGVVTSAIRIKGDVELF